MIVLVTEEAKDPLPQIVKPGGAGNPPEGSKFGFENMFTGVRSRGNNNQ